MSTRKVPRETRTGRPLRIWTRSQAFAHAREAHDIIPMGGAEFLRGVSLKELNLIFRERGYVDVTIVEDLPTHPLLNPGNPDYDELSPLRELAVVE